MITDSIMKHNIIQYTRIRSDSNHMGVHDTTPDTRITEQVIGALQVGSHACKVIGALQVRSHGCKVIGALQVRSHACKVIGALQVRSHACNVIGAL